MGLYNFKARFVPLIESGAKTHTIRELRKYPSKPGEPLYLYEGLRTKRARRILPVVPCTAVEDIQIYRVYRLTIAPGSYAAIVEFSVKIGKQDLAGDEIEAFARRDGFRDFEEMMDFWRAQKRRFPWRGHVIHWRFPGTSVPLPRA
jgi:hypothetical protein